MPSNDLFDQVDLERAMCDAVDKCEAARKEEEEEAELVMGEELLKVEAAYDQQREQHFIDCHSNQKAGWLFWCDSPFCVDQWGICPVTKQKHKPEEIVGLTMCNCELLGVVNPYKEVNQDGPDDEGPYFDIFKTPHRQGQGGIAVSRVKRRLTDMKSFRQGVYRRPALQFEDHEVIYIDLE